MFFPTTYAWASLRSVMNSRVVVRFGHGLCSRISVDFVWVILLEQEVEKIRAKIQSKLHNTQGNLENRIHSRETSALMLHGMQRGSQALKIINCLGTTRSSRSQHDIASIQPVLYMRLEPAAERNINGPLWLLARVLLTHTSIIVQPAKEMNNPLWPPTRPGMI